MGIIKAAADAVGKGLADQWLEVIEADAMGDQTIFCKGVKIREGQNKKGLSDVVSNGSVIHVYPNQFMMLLDGGKVVDYTAEEGYYKVDNSSMPSLFNGQFGAVLMETFDRIRYGGETAKKQVVYFINLQEIKGIKFGTKTPVNYFDNFYNAELFLRAHGVYSIKVTDPLKFYSEVIPKDEDRVEIDIINEQYLSEFLSALQSSINQMSADGTRVSYVSSKSRELGTYMASTLDADWNQMRGMEIQSVGIASISYDDESQRLINMRNQGSMLGDPTVREGYVQGAIARGLEAAGSNTQGAMNGFLGMGIGMNAGGGFMASASAANLQQMQMNQAYQGNQNQPNQANQAYQTNQPNQAYQPNQTSQAHQPNQTSQAYQTNQANQPAGNQANQPAVSASASTEWTCECGNVSIGKFCPDCGKPRPAAEWSCACGTVNTGKFCSECGNPRQ